MPNPLTDFELQALAAALAGEHPMLALLRAQLADLTVVQREYTDAGFFVALGVNRQLTLPAPLVPRLAISDVDASVEGLRSGAGIVLFVEDGAMTLLEGFTYGEPWPATPRALSFVYRDPSRSGVFKQLDSVKTAVT